jgi:phospholipase/carboxylesterase
VRWVFPASPTQDGPVGSEWFPLDVMAWMGAFMGGEQVLAAKLRETPAGLPEASEKVIALLGALCRASTGGDLGKWVVGGFSQGAMMACDVTSRLQEGDRSALFGSGAGRTVPGGLLVVSGMPMNINEWAVGLGRVRQAAAARRLDVLQLHGQQDMTCPFHASGWLRDLIKQGAPDAVFHSHGGGHDMGGMSEIALMAEFLEKRASA